MLHELFLLLSGHPSPILTPKGLPPSFPLVSPSERALLTSLSTLGHLHISLRNACSLITTAHPSTIARAVTSGIDTHHLQSFRSKIIAVEKSVLQREAGVVGGYDIVSLAKVLSRFDGWERILRYLHELTESILPGSSKPEKSCGRCGRGMTGAELINRLRNDIHTGYPTLEEVSLDLLKVAETAWLREVSTWVLYGRLPSSSSFGSDSASSDFFITETSGETFQNPGGEEEMGVLKEYTITKKLLPEFVTPQTASSVLFIGRALSMIRLRGGSAINTEISSAIASPEVTLLPVHLFHLQSLHPPLSSQKLYTAISAIRLSLSRHTLQTLLPASKIVDVVHVLREFFLLGRGEFAVALVEQSSERVRNRWRRPGAGGGVGTLGVKIPGTGALVKEGEVSAVLTRTWGVLSSLQGEEGNDERLDTARDLLYLSLNKPPVTSATPVPKSKTMESFKDILVGVSVSLNFHLSWPLELFLQPADLEIYDGIFAYLISVRRTQIRLQSLWQGRRYPPPQLSLSSTKNKEAAKNRREVLKKRSEAERKIWATASVGVFFLETVVGYWQGEVIEGSFANLMSVLNTDSKSPNNEPPKKKTKTSTDEEEQEDEEEIDIITHHHDIWTTPQTPNRSSTSKKTPQTHQDPESLTRAHHLYLSTLKRGLFLTDPLFPPLLRKFLLACDVLVTFITRLEKRNQMLDLNLGNSGGDERDAEKEMQALLDTCVEVRKLLGRLVERLHVMDEERDGGGGGGGVFESGSGSSGFGGAALGAAAVTEVGKVDRLLMRLDLGNLRLGEVGG